MNEEQLREVWKNHGGAVDRIATETGWSREALLTLWQIYVESVRWTNTKDLLAPMEQQVKRLVDERTKGNEWEKE